MTAHAPVGTVDGVGDTRTARFERVLRRPPEGAGRTDATASLVRWFIRATIEPRVGGVASFDPARRLRPAP
jgi:hypothetical protein